MLLCKIIELHSDRLYNKTADMIGLCENKRAKATQTLSLAEGGVCNLVKTSSCILLFLVAEKN